MAATKEKSAWIDTYVYASCDSAPSNKPTIKCDIKTGIFNYLNNYGYFRRWVCYLQGRLDIVLCFLTRFQDTIYWNFCPTFFYKQDIATTIKSTTDDAHKNTHFMENYYDTREQWLIPAFMSIRSIGIPESNVGISADLPQKLTNDLVIFWNYNVHTPETAREMALMSGIQYTAKNCT